MGGEGAAKSYGVINKLTGGLILATMQSATSLLIDGMAVNIEADRLIIPEFFLVGHEKSKYVDEDTDIHCSGGTSGTTTDNTTTESDEYLKAISVRALEAGDRVSVQATLEDLKIKYVVLNRY
jgi:hypothetical protein